jgi:hypothetical protein
MQDSHNRPKLELVVPAKPGGSKEPGGSIQVGEHSVELPGGVSAGDWTLEKVSIQNPRIRSFLGCLDLLEEVLDSNFAILHCSPERLGHIQRRVARVAQLIRSEIGPLLKGPSKIPALEAARRSSELSLQTLSVTALAEVDRITTMIEEGQIIQARKMLCVSIGKLHSFLQDTFGKLMAADPRSVHDSDYFLSRRFPRDIEEAEWLYTTVDRLYSYLKRLGASRSEKLTVLAERLRHEGTVPDGEAWTETRSLLDSLLDELTPLLKEILAQRGIRFDEMEMLDRYTIELPTQCNIVLELYSTAHELTERIMSDSERSVQERIDELTSSHQILGRRTAALLDSVAHGLDELGTFVPIWLKHIELRRALLLKKVPDETY